MIAPVFARPKVSIPPIPLLAGERVLVTLKPQVANLVSERLHLSCLRWPAIVTAAAVVVIPVTFVMAVPLVDARLTP
jgi:hypothetical protein